MDSAIGVVGKDFVLLAADCSQARSILKMKGDLDKIFQIDSHKLFALTGEAADRENFGHYIQKNIKLYALRTGLTLSNHAAAHFARSEMAEALRRAPYQANVLFGGYDAAGPALYFLDYLGLMHKVDFGAHGYAANFVLSIFDRHHKKDCTLDEAMELINMCLKELQTRFLINQPDFVIKVIDKNGIRILRAPGAPATTTTTNTTTTTLTTSTTNY